MAVVTITGHLGALGAIPARVADELGYLLADRRLLTQAAGALGWSEPQAEAYDERTDAQRGRMSQFLSEFVHLAPFTPIDDIDAYTLESLALGAYGDWVASAEMRPADRRFLGVLTALVKSLAEAGDVVIVGRGSGLVVREQARHLAARAAGGGVERGVRNRGLRAERREHEADTTVARHGVQRWCDDADANDQWQRERRIPGSAGGWSLARATRAAVAN